MQNCQWRCFKKIVTLLILNYCLTCLTCFLTGDLPRGPVLPAALHGCGHRQSSTGEREQRASRWVGEARRCFSWRCLLCPQIYRRGAERISDLTWESLKKEVTIAVETEVTRCTLSPTRRHCRSRGAHIVLLRVIPAAAEQRDGVRVLPGRVPATAGRVLVQVLRLLLAVPGGPVHAAGTDREPAHRHGVSAEKGNVPASASHCRSAASFQERLKLRLRLNYWSASLKVHIRTVFAS